MPLIEQLFVVIFEEIALDRKKVTIRLDSRYLTLLAFVLQIIIGFFISSYPHLGNPELYILGAEFYQH
jgi:hypothetical protein